jgi:hypothetical protein
MKNILFTLIFLFSLTSFSQYVSPNQNKVNVTVKQEQTIGQQIAQGRQAAAAQATANAATETARAQAMKDNYSKVNIDLLKDNGNKYKYVVLRSVTGWMPEENIKTINNTLKGSNIYGFVSQLGPKRRWSHREMPEVISRRQDEVLYLSWHREEQGSFTRTSKLTLEDYNNKVIFQADYKNIGYSEMLNPLLSEYITSAEDQELKNNLERDIALKKIKEAKELLDLGVISQQEYQALVDKYKPILLRN